MYVLIFIGIVVLLFYRHVEECICWYGTVCHKVQSTMLCWKRRGCA